jgi:hypothetical protein
VAGTPLARHVSPCDSSRLLKKSRCSPDGASPRACIEAIGWGGEARNLVALGVVVGAALFAVVVLVVPLPR